MDLFIDKLRQTCKDQPAWIAFPESEDSRIRSSAKQLLDENSVAGVYFISARQLPEFSQYGERVKFKAPGESALDTAAELLYRNEVQAVIAGAVETTADVIRAGIRGVGLAEGVRTVSGSFIMNKPGSHLCLYADCGAVISPNAKQLCDIAVSSVETWQKLYPDAPPYVAFLSFSTKGSAEHESISKIHEAVSMFKEVAPKIAVDGELQFDAAFDKEIGHKKAPGSEVCGNANIFIFPDLNSGNIAYKITQRLAGYGAYGPILQGLAKPFSDLSRGSTIEDILASSYINLIRGRN